MTITITAASGLGSRTVSIGETGASRRSARTGAHAAPDGSTGVADPSAPPGTRPWRGGRTWSARRRAALPPTTRADVTQQGVALARRQDGTTASQGACAASAPAADRRAGIRGRWGTVVAQGTDTGMATAEYAIAMIAAVGFAGLLVTVLSSGTVRTLLSGLVTSALSMG